MVSVMLFEKVDESRNIATAVGVAVVRRQSSEK